MIRAGLRITVLLAAIGGMASVSAWAQPPTPPASAYASIGTARMWSDRTIELDLGPADGLGGVNSKGELGYGRLQIAPHSPHYQELLEHLGGLRPGEVKPVPPWRSDETWHCALDPDRGPCPLGHSLDRTATAN
jgi:hypothetical protein